MRIHFTIPAYQESKRLPRYLLTLLTEIQKCVWDVTVQVVDDGSGPQETERLLSELSPLHKQFPQLLPTIILEKNLGKGGAVYTGWHQAPECDLLGFVDADGSIPAGELVRLCQLAGQCSDTAIFGSRILMLGRTVKRSAFRHYVGRVFATITSTLLEIPVYDSQCGIKIIPAGTFRAFASDCREFGFAFDTELLLLLKRERCAIREEAIDWHDTPGSKVNVVRDGMRMIGTLLRLRNRFITRR
ncbi:MAG: glycosyltransferase [Verrucomicrobiota bacterium]